MAKRKGNLLMQLTLSLGLAIAFIGLASFYYQYRVQKHILMGSIRDDTLRQAQLLRQWLATARSPEDVRDVAGQYIETIERTEEDHRKLVVVDKDMKVVKANTGQEPGEPFASGMLEEVMASGGPSEGTATVVGDDYVIALPLYADVGETRVRGGILLREPLTAVDRLADSLMLGAFVLLAASLIAMVIVVHIVLRLKVHKPMQAIFMQEYRIREGDLAKIEAEDPANEFSDLYAMYNEMVVRIAQQKSAILEQKDHVALAHLVRQAISRLTGPLDEISTRSQELLEHQSSLSQHDRAALKEIIANITRIARELQSIVVEGSRSATWLKREAEKMQQYRHLTEEGETPQRGKGVPG